MFGKHGTVWQVGLAVVGLAIVGIVLIGPRGRGTTPLVAAPSADVASNSLPAQAILQPQPVQQQQSSDQPAGGQAAGADGSASAGADASGQPAASTASSTVAKAIGSAVLPALPAVPAAPAVQTLFSDNFSSDPLGLGLPTGWLIADPASSSSSSSGGLLGGVPIVGSLLGGLTGGGSASSATSLVPSIVNDGTHVLSRANGSWSHLAAGPVTVDSTASMNVKMLGKSSGFVGIAGRFADINNSVMCGLNSGGSVLQIWQIVAGHAQMLASSPVSAATGVFHTISMAMQGGQMSCSLDGANLLHATGSWTSPGRIGLVALGDMTSEFSDVVATALP